MENPLAPKEIIKTKIPATVFFSIGILLFLLPFAELKCGQSKTKTDLGGINLNLGGNITFSNTGLGLATGSQWKTQMNGLGGLLSGDNKADKEQPAQSPNYYAIVALLLGIVGLSFCFIKLNGSIWISLLSGLLSAVALIGLRFDLDKKIKDPSRIIQKNDSAGESAGILSDGLDAMKFEMNYTAWYYIAVVAMLAAAVFCYLWIKNSPKPVPVS